LSAASVRHNHAPAPDLRRAGHDRAEQGPARPVRVIVDQDQVMALRDGELRVPA